MNDLGSCFLSIEMSLKTRFSELWKIQIFADYFLQMLAHSHRKEIISGIGSSQDRIINVLTLR